jgi:hypothetical protein
MAMEHDRIHQLALKVGYNQNRYMYKLTDRGAIIDDKFREYTELLIEDIFNNIAEITEKNVSLTHQDLYQKIRQLYIRDNNG